MSSAERFEEAIQNLDSVIDPEALFQEACFLVQEMKRDHPNRQDGEPTPEELVEQFLAMTCDDSFAEMAEKNLYATPNHVKRVLEVSVGNVPQSTNLLQGVSKERFEVCLGLIRTSLERGTFLKKQFSSMIRMNDPVPLEVLWRLHTVGAMCINDGLERLRSDPRRKAKFIEALMELVTGIESTQQLRQQIVSGIMGHLIQKAFTDKKTTETQFYRVTADAILAGVLDLQVDAKDEDNLALPTNIEHMPDTMNQTVITRFAVHGLSSIISRNNRFSVQDCLRSVSDLHSLKTSFIFNALLNQLLLPLSYQDSFDILTRYLDEETISSPALFSFLSSLYIHFTTATERITEHICMLLSNALNLADIKIVSTAFLLARLSCLLGRHCFPSYGDWFMATFTGPNAVSMTRPSYTFLVRFLTNLVPSESAEYLKVHILTKPTLPPKCKDLFADYTMLAKTRLSDLGVSLFEQKESLYEGSAELNNQDKKTAVIDSIEQDIQRILVTFTETKKIPAVLLEASMFRRPYFMGRFLPALLRSRVLPDVPDERMLLIEEIYRSGKIPSAVYSKYTQDCEKEKQMLFEGVFDVDEDDDDEMYELALPLNSQFEKKMEKFSQAVLSRNSHAEKGCISALIEKVDAILTSSISNRPEVNIQSNVSDNVLDVDITKCSPSDPSYQICKVLITQLSILVTRWNEMHKLTDVDSVASSHRCCTKQDDLFRPIHMLIQVLLQRIAELRKTFYTFVLAVVKKSKQEDVTLSTACLPLLCVVLASLPYKLSMKLTSDGQNTQTQSRILCFGEAMLQCLDVGSGTSNALRFCLEYATIACRRLLSVREELDQQGVVEVTSSDVTNRNDLLPRALVKRVIFYCGRYHQLDSMCDQTSGMSGDSVRDNLIESLRKDNVWENLTDKYEVTLEDWVKMELTMDTTSDTMASANHWSYIWSQSSMLLQRNPDLRQFCKTLILTLARFMDTQCCLKNNDSTKISCFVKLLQRMLTRLSPREGEGKTWLEDVLVSSDLKILSQVIKLVLDLPAHLLFCDSLQENRGSADMDSACNILGYFLKSSVHKGGYLSVDATMYMLEAVTTLFCMQANYSLVDVDSIMLHPLLFTSCLVHKRVIKNLHPDLFSLPNLPLWQQQLSRAMCAVDDMSEQNLIRLEPWQKAACLFVSFLQRNYPASLFELNLDTDVQVFLLRLILIHLITKGAWDEIQNPTEGNIAFVFVKVLQPKAATILAQLLDTAVNKVGRCNVPLKLGEESLPLFASLADLFILRLAMHIPANIILKSAESGENITSTVISAYWRVVARMQEEQPSIVEVLPEEMTRWMKSLIDMTPQAHLQAVPDYPEPTPLTGILISRYLQERKRKKKY